MNSNRNLIDDDTNYDAVQTLSLLQIALQCLTLSLKPDMLCHGADVHSASADMHCHSAGVHSVSADMHCHEMCAV